MSKMKQMAGILAMGAILGETMSDAPAREVSKSTEPPNGNHTRTHKQNVKRRKVRKIQKASRKINRAA